MLLAGYQQTPTMPLHGGSLLMTQLPPSKSLLSNNQQQSTSYQNSHLPSAFYQNGAPVFASQTNGTQNPFASWSPYCDSDFDDSLGMRNLHSFIYS